MTIKLIIYILLLGGSIGHRIMAQEFQSISIADYQEWLGYNERPLQIVNFWATWCAPCLKELPELIRAQKNFQKVADVRLISLDDSQRQAQVIRTLSRHDYNGPVFLLEAGDQELPQIYRQWNGAVPLTLIYNSRHELIRAYEKEIDYETIQKLVNQNLK